MNQASMANDNHAKKFVSQTILETFGYDEL